MYINIEVSITVYSSLPAGRLKQLVGMIPRDRAPQGAHPWWSRKSHSHRIARRLRFA
jgi:hypothetical protein